LPTAITSSCRARGEATTKAGVPYNNEYRFIYRFENGAIKEATEPS
jgi:ketosteroid isomerase-like protein